MGYGLVGSTEAGVNRLAQIHLAHIRARSAQAGACSEIFDVDDAQRGVFECELFVAVAQVAGAANRALNFEGLGLGAHGNRFQRDAGAAIVKAGLINLDAAVARRVIHLDPRRNLLAGFLIVNDDVTGEQLGHAGRVILHIELF